MFFFRVQKYLRYKLFARHKRGYGVHSPFLYELIREVVRNKTLSPVVFTIERIRKKCIGDKRTIVINDLGAGSSVTKSNVRKVSSIARYSSLPKKYGLLLTNLASAFGKKRIIELGTCMGISTMYLAKGGGDAIVHTIEGSESIAQIAATNFADAGITNIKQHVGSFDDLLPEICQVVGTPGLVFVDGNHRKEPVLKYFNILADASDSETVIIFDDIYYSPGMAEAWEKIKADKRVSLSIDLYRMGIVFFKDGLSRGSCVLRY